MLEVTSAGPVSGTAAPDTPSPRLVRAAHEFEAQMMKELMEPLHRGSSLIGSDGDADEDTGAGSALGEFACEALGRALSEHGGFGIASAILKKLSPHQNHNETLPVTGISHGNTVIKPGK